MAALGLPGAASPVLASPEAQKFVDNLVNNGISQLTKQDLTDDERNERFRSLFRANFDVEAIGRFVVGARHWRTANESQQKEYIGLFEDITVLTWAKRFKEYNGPLPEVGVAEPADANGVISVPSKVFIPNSQPVILIWRVRSNSEMKVIDMVVEGVSMALTQQNDYRSILEREKMEGLIIALKNKREQMKAGKDAVKK
jgi:phospholipid transport system substrate-binding protein